MSAEASVLDVDLSLADLTDRRSLQDLCDSTFDLFGFTLRVLSAHGAVLASAGHHKGLGPEAGVGEVVDVSTTGSLYHVAPVTYEGRTLGRVVLGPVPGADSWHSSDPSTIPARAAEAERMKKVAAHFCLSLELALFGGHKAALTSQLHLAAVKDGYRELQDKNRKLQAAYDKLKELDQLKSNFLGMVSHELRTPLTSIIGYGEILAEGLVGSLTSEQHEYVQTIRHKGEQLLRLITSLLDLSKLESQTIRLHKEPTDVGLLMHATVDTFLPIAQKKGIEIRCLEPDRVPPVEVDPVRLTQVISNLVDNALKFSHLGGVVTLGARLVWSGDGTRQAGVALLAPASARVELSVSDTGVGIVPRERERVFDAFYQVDSTSTREYGGAGLGLAIAQRIVLAHGGQIEVRANEPCGSVFVISLPLRDA